MLRDRARSDAGFSLAEVLVAVAVMATALTALASLFTLSIESNLASRHRTYSTVLAQQKLEELRSEHWEPSAPPSISGHDYLDLAGKVVGEGADPAGRGVYERQWSVAPLPSNPGNAVAIQVEAMRKNAGSNGLDRTHVFAVKTTTP
jgi:prepilin-type N-terminal cleavage/methylation domain-containing protein